MSAPPTASLAPELLFQVQSSLKKEAVVELLVRKAVLSCPFYSKLSNVGIAVDREGGFLEWMFQIQLYL